MADRFHIAQLDQLLSQHTQRPAGQAFRGRTADHRDQVGLLASIQTTPTHRTRFGGQDGFLHATLSTLPARVDGLRIAMAPTLERLDRLDLLLRGFADHVREQQV